MGNGSPLLTPLNLRGDSKEMIPQAKQWGRTLASQNTCLITRWSSVQIWPDPSTV